jgi:hypothetical protein
MPYLNVEIYREREKRWREEAKSKPNDAERDACLSLAEGYAKLVSIIERIEFGKEAQAGEDVL